MTDFLKNRDVLVNFSRESDVLVLQIFGVAQKNGSAQFVIQETALDVAGGSDRGSRIEADEISGHDAQFFHIFFGRNRLVDDYLHGVPGTGGVAVFSVYMNGSVDELQGAVVAGTVIGADADVFCLGVVGIHAADVGDAESSIAFYLGNHAA